MPFSKFGFSSSFPQIYSLDTAVIWLGAYLRCWGLKRAFYTDFGNGKVTRGQLFLSNFWPLLTSLTEKRVLKLELRKIWLLLVIGKWPFWAKNSGLNSFMFYRIWTTLMGCSLYSRPGPPHTHAAVFLYIDSCTEVLYYCTVLVIEWTIWTVLLSQLFIIG